MDTKNKIDKPTFINEEDIPLINQDEDYDDYGTPPSRLDETSFMVPNASQATSTLQATTKTKAR